MQEYQQNLLEKYIILMIKNIDLFKQYKSIKKDIDRTIYKVIKTTDFVNGKSTKEFEKKFAEYNNIKYCLGVNSGTDALEIAIKSFNFPKNSEIILPVNSFIATAEAISNNQLKPVFCDCNKNNYSISAKEIIQNINKKTVAIIIVHLYGYPVNINKIKKIAKKRKLKVIEDCAQAHGAKYKNKKVGTFFDVGTFSFYPGKNLGAYGDAGAIVSNNKKIYKKCSLIANHGREDKNEHIIIGRNSRLDGIQAAILKTKLKYLNKWISKRNLLAQEYFKNLKNLSQIKLPIINPKSLPSFHQFVIQAKKRDQLKLFLNKEQIETNIHYPKTITQQPAYKENKNYKNAEFFAKNIISLPIGEHLKISDIKDICLQINKFYEKNFNDNKKRITTR